MGAPGLGDQRHYQLGSPGPRSSDEGPGLVPPVPRGGEVAAGLPSKSGVGDSGYRFTLRQDPL